MKLKKILAVAVGVGLCVGGEVWGADVGGEKKTEVSMMFVTVNPPNNDEYDVFFQLVIKDLNDPIASTVKEPITNEQLKWLKELVLFKPAQTDNFCYIVFLPNDNKVKEEQIREIKGTIWYFMNSTTIPKLLKKDITNNFPISNNEKNPVIMRDEKSEMSEKPYNQSSFKDKIVHIDGKIVTWLQKENHLDMVCKAAIKKFEELNVKRIPVTVSPQGEVFFGLEANIQENVDVIFSTMKKSDSETIIKKVKELALFDPSKTNDCYYYLFIPEDPKNSIKKEFIGREPNNPTQPYYFINLTTISKLVAKDDNYLIPEQDLKNIDINDDVKILLKDKTVLIDGKVVNWLRAKEFAIGYFPPQNIVLIENAAIKKFKELGGKLEVKTGTTDFGKALEIADQADLDNLAKTLYQLALPAK